MDKCSPAVIITAVGPVKTANIKKYEVSFLNSEPKADSTALETPPSPGNCILRLVKTLAKRAPRITIIIQVKIA